MAGDEGSLYLPDSTTLGIFLPRTWAQNDRAGWSSSLRGISSGKDPRLTEWRRLRYFLRAKKSDCFSQIPLDIPGRIRQEWQVLNRAQTLVGITGPTSCAAGRPPGPPNSINVCLSCRLIGGSLLLQLPTKGQRRKVFSAAENTIKRPRVGKAGGGGNTMDRQVCFLQQTLGSNQPAAVDLREDRSANGAGESPF